MIKVVNRTCQAKSVGNPFGTIPAPCPLHKKWGKLRQNHPSPIVTISLGVLIKRFDGCNLLVTCGHTNNVVVLLSIFKRFANNAARSEGCDAYGSVVGHDQFCVRVLTLGCPADYSVVPGSLTLVEGYAKLVWFCWLYYPIV